MKVSPVRAWAVGPMVTWEGSGPVVAEAAHRDVDDVGLDLARTS